MIIQKGKGGLRKGHSGVSDRASLKIDRNLKQIRDNLSNDLQIDGLELKRKINESRWTTPCEPDGGAWYYRGSLIAVFEAKKQQNAGNAIERWYKNMYLCRKINPEVSYVTFCRGEGACKEGVIGKLLDVAHLLGFNQYNAGDNSCWLSKDGFTEDFIEETMKSIILERIENINRGE
jgi:hypothetical protein